MFAVFTNSAHQKRDRTAWKGIYHLMKKERGNEYRTGETEVLLARFAVPASRLKQEDLLLQVLTQVFLDRRVARGAPGDLEGEHPSIERVKAYLTEHYAEEVSLETLAHIAHLSPFHLARLFRHVVGLPPHAYHIQVRLSQARTLLAQGCSVSYVAQETGFFDQTHLTRQFKQHFGVTPGIYRKAARLY